MIQLNSVQISGFIATEPVLRRTNSSRPVLNIRAGVTRKWKDRDGASQEHTDFIPTVFWADSAEQISKLNLKMGDEVLIEGRLSSRDVEEIGLKRSVLEITGNKLSIVSRKADREVLRASRVVEESGDGVAA